MTYRLMAALALVATSLVLSACDNTVRGVGQDVKETGHAVESVAK